MIRSIRYITLLVLLQFVTGISVLYAQSITSASGIVRDSVSGEPLSYVSVMFENSTIGAMTDDDGAFSLQNDKGLTRLVVSSLGYDNKVVNLKAGQKNNALNVLLRPTSFEIAEVVVKPKREKYSRKDNPAVELIKKVIEHKNDNRIEAKDEYQSEVYEKLSMSLDDFNPNLEKNKFLKKFKFIKNYLDTSEFNGKPILTISVRETISDQYYRKHPKAEKTITKAKRQQGIDKTLDDGGAITANLEEIFKGVNIFDNNINILLNRFVSPLSSTLAVSYYKYYIMDTVDVAGDKCVDLAFVPVNSQSYGFTGRLYITLDGNYAVKKFLLNTPANINLNWVDKLRIEQEFKRMPDSTWVLANENTYVNFYIVKGAQQLYAHQLRNFDKYQFDVQNADSIFGLLGPNGSGKTTAINCLLSLLKYDKGDIEIFGQKMTPDNYEVKQQIGIVLQNVAVFDELTVSENIDYFCGLYIHDRNRRRELVEEAIRFVGLEDYRKTRPQKLSGGLLRRLNIACGIAHKPRLIILDEPTVAVDPQSRNKILEGIQELNRQGSTIIYTSHYMEEVEQICTRIAIMDHGRVIASGTTEELKKMIKTGETITVEALLLTEKQLQDIRNLPHVFDVHYEDQILTLRCTGAQHNLIRILNYLQSQNLTFGRVFSELPTLNDVFLEITGKQLRD